MLRVVYCIFFHQEKSVLDFLLEASSGEPDDKLRLAMIAVLSASQLTDVWFPHDVPSRGCASQTCRVLALVHTTRVTNPPVELQSSISCCSRRCTGRSAAVPERVGGSRLQLVSIQLYHASQVSVLLIDRVEMKRMINSFVVLDSLSLLE